MLRLNTENRSKNLGFILAWARQPGAARRYDVHRSTVSRFFLLYTITESASEPPGLSEIGQRNNVYIFQQKKGQGICVSFC